MKPNTFLRLFVAAKRSRTVGQAKGRLRCKPMIELLEDRLAPAAFMVNSTLDTDDGLGFGAVTTLRKAIRLANVDAVADTINFDPALANQTIILGGTALPISQPVTITGLGSDMLTINANNASRIFIINDGTAADIAVSISGLRLTGGNTDSGGAIFNTEALTLAACALDHNAADHFGGAVYNSLR